MRLYYSPGGASLGAHIALREAGRRFELVRVDLRNHRTADGADFLAINPRGGIPALQIDRHGEAVLFQHASILQYIADLAPEARLAPPSGTFARYHLQGWLELIAVELEARFELLFDRDTPVFVQQRLRARLGERFSYLSDVLSDRAHLMGETFTVADAYLFAVLRWCDRFDLDVDLWPNLGTFFARVEERSAVQAALVAEGLARHLASGTRPPAGGDRHPPAM